MWYVPGFGLSFKKEQIIKLILLQNVFNVLF